MIRAVLCASVPRGSALDGMHRPPRADSEQVGVGPGPRQVTVPEQLGLVLIAGFHLSAASVVGHVVSSVSFVSQDELERNPSYSCP